MVVAVVVRLAAFLENDEVVLGKKGSIMSFFVDLKLFAGQGHGLNPKCVDETVLVLDDLSTVVI